MSKSTLGSLKYAIKTEDRAADEAKAELKGVTLESLVVAVRVARAVRARAERGEIDLKDFPLLMHVDEILTQHAPVDIPWEDFTFVQP